MALAEKENKLTPLGKDVLRRLNIAYADAYRRECDLTRLGGRQHYGIASRMLIEIEFYHTTDFLIFS